MAGWTGMTDEDGAASSGDPGGTDDNAAAGPPEAEPGPPGAEPGPGGAERTGTALARSPGDQAGLTAPPVTYEFPVEISLVGELDGTALARIAELIFAELDRELSSRL